MADKAQNARCINLASAAFSSITPIPKQKFRDRQLVINHRLAVWDGYTSPVGFRFYPNLFYRSRLFLPRPSGKRRVAAKYLSESSASVKGASATGSIRY